VVGSGLEDPASRIPRTSTQPLPLSVTGVLEVEELAPPLVVIENAIQLTWLLIFPRM
jgi:hypothetical protein